MADPVYDEDYIRGLLSVPVNHDNSEAIQVGSVQALMDLYDRKVTREEFAQGAAACVGLYGQCAKYWILHSIRESFETGMMTSGTFDRATASLEDLIRVQAGAVIEIVKRLQLCPTSKDPVH